MSWLRDRRWQQEWMQRHLSPHARDEQMMEMALRHARIAEALGEVPVGAVVVRDGCVIGMGHNLRETHHDPTAHAEMIALRQAAYALGSWRLNDCTLYVTLEPCPMCAGAIVNARIERLVYGAADPKMGCIDTLYELCSDPRFNHSVLIDSGLLSDRCGQILRGFFRRRRRENRNGHKKTQDIQNKNRDS